MKSIVNASNATKALIPVAMVALPALVSSVAPALGASPDVANALLVLLSAALGAIARHLHVSAAAPRA